MRYKPPKTNNKEQWVPIVVKNKDWLVGYISGIQMVKSIIIKFFEENGICVDFRGLDLCLDSSRFNDIMENGKRESECTDQEIKKYYEKIINKKIDMIKEYHPDNDHVLKDYFLEIECPCGFGVFLFKTPKEIPEKSFRCPVCKKVVIDYTGKDDDAFDYDGDFLRRIQLIYEKLYEKTDDNEDKEED